MTFGIRNARAKIPHIYSQLVMVHGRPLNEHAMICITNHTLNVGNVLNSRSEMVEETILLTAAVHFNFKCYTSSRRKKHHTASAATLHATP